jgi:prepilin-type N-terminal cleavage/methylation domain-containing protein
VTANCEPENCEPEDCKTVNCEPVNCELENCEPEDCKPVNCELENCKPNCELSTVNCELSRAGFSLLEVLIATSLLVVVALGSAQLFVLAVRHTVAARQQLLMTLAAARKVDELSAAAAAGPIVASPPDALARGADGFAEVVMESGLSCVRRWSVAPIPVYGGRLIAIVVRVSVPGVPDVQIATIRESP